MPQNGDATGLVFNIQRFSVHDGPGIRTEVFMKGCPLKCKWCSNPEGLKPFGQVGVFTQRCLGVDKCGLCLSVCPKAADGALMVSDNRISGIDRSVCTDCLACGETCPSPNTMKIWGRRMTVSEAMDVILSDREFYDRSGGGLTLSGGEALLHPDFAEELFKACQAQGIHTCLESTLFCQPSLLDRILPHVDFLITDIKHMDPIAHQSLTGVSNERILENMEKAVLYPMPLVIRIPVVPGMNDDERNIAGTAEYISDNLGGRVVQVQLLPYKELGVEKYKALGVQYPMADYCSLQRSEWEANILKLVGLMERYGIPAVAGASSKIK